MLVIRTLQDLARAATPAGGLGGILVPTMGALHAGHAALIREAATLARDRDLRDGCAVSIFVNPTQFDDPADFDRYPRTLEADLEICREAGAATLFIPEVQAMYPPGEEIPIPPLPAVATQPGLEDAHRPGHFAGVCQIVLRLFRLLQPTAALFGEKDFQQLRTIQAMVSEAALPIEIISYSTIRDSDGLAMSSRNRFLSPAERTAALAIPNALCQACSTTDPAEAEQIMHQLLARSGLQIEYAVVRNAQTLLGYQPHLPGRALIAARSGRTRLIDNASWPR